ncbi:hypothetical protein ACIGO8_23440 [Streptomyces sp. NPDC053493]|uniref:hypothetical protein n=1 Tax=Streptomyces sp. NPDC053493 TaxID=3365705 RepID=UPI0037CDA749
MNTTQRTFATLLLAGAALGLSGAPQALAADDAGAPGAGLVGLLKLDEVGHKSEPQGSVSGNTSVANIGGQTTDLNT